MPMQGQGSLLSTALPFAKLVAPEILWWPMDKSSRCRGRFGGSGGCNCPPTDRRIHQGFADFSCSQSWIFIGDLSVQLIDRTLYENSLRNYKQISPLLNFRKGNSNNFLDTKSHSPSQFAWFKPNTIKLDQSKNFGGQWWCWSVDIKQNIICRPALWGQVKSYWLPLAVEIILIAMHSWCLAEPFLFENQKTVLKPQATDSARWMP